MGIDGGRNGMSKKLMTKLMFPCICVCLFLAFIAARTVEPAHLGIVSVFGSVSETTLESGLHFVNPFATVIPFNLKTQLLYSEQNVPTQEGLTVVLDVSLLYHLNDATVRELFVTLGVDFESTLILPELQSAVRGLTSEVSAKALYTSGRTEIRDKLMARMEFVLTKEKQEADRKKIEAEGISSFQRIVSEGISTQLLQWKGIEATEKLAASDNAKLVVMGNTKDSLPVLLASASEDDARSANRMSHQSATDPKAAADASTPITFP